MKKTFCLLFLIILLSGPIYAADIIYVQSLKAKIFSEPNFGSQLIGQAQRGTRLQVIEEGKGWYKVSSEAHLGWVSRLCVGENPPMEEVTVITEDTPDLEKNARKRASETTSSAAARGLTPADRKRLSDDHEADHHSLHKLITFTEDITEEEVEHFSRNHEAE
ncbi:MAG: SH3 domain-containing protein [bacterium]